MKISLQEVDRILRAQELTRAQDHRPTRGSVTEEAGSSTSAAQAAEAVRVEVSPQALEVQLIRQAVEEAPDARDEMVAELKARIESGTYDVSSEDIADLMLRRAYADSIR